MSNGSTFWIALVLTLIKASLKLSFVKVTVRVTIIFVDYFNEKVCLKLKIPVDSKHVFISTFFTYSVLLCNFCSGENMLNTLLEG